MFFLGPLFGTCYLPDGCFWATTAPWMAFSRFYNSLSLTMIETWSYNIWSNTFCLDTCGEVFPGFPEANRLVLSAIPARLTCFQYLIRSQHAQPKPTFGFDFWFLTPGMHDAMSTSRHAGRREGQIFQSWSAWRFAIIACSSEGVSCWSHDRVEVNGTWTRADIFFCRSKVSFLQLGAQWR